MSNIHDAMQNLFCKLKATYQAQQREPKVMYEADWPSEIYQGDPDKNGEIVWRPHTRSVPARMDNIADSLESVIPEQLSEYYGGYYSANIAAKTQRGELELLLPWNEEDFERLQKNLIAHILMKRKLRQAETWFFAVTDQDDFNLAVLGNSGEVVLERVGCEPQEVIAQSLSDFILTCEPVII